MNSSIPLIDDYRENLITSFEDWYKFGRDIWSSEHQMRQFINIVTSSLPVHSDMSALDIGAGRGNDSLHLVSLGYQVTAIDICRMEEWDSIEVDYSSKISFIKSDFIQWDNICNKYDLIIDNGCFHHQHPDLLLIYLEKIKRYLKPNGTFAINIFYDPFSSQSYTLTLSDGRLIHILDEKSLNSMFNKVFLKIRKTIKINRNNKNFKYDYLYLMLSHIE